ncbi:GTP-binding protein [Aquibacillus saliphilus]|uniref:GTP-binding protein n=1 Tax=Aquibacillus saliphilus TaxID=1909422 RepID=UPI001CF0581D|nr:TetM/TetW/TetO/TetS family tetracycline resistance ribosomal protection protein [Aquibacillus saliphilus]
MYKTIGLLAHVDAGKTTFSEQLLYHTKSIRHLGRVDHKDAFLDSHQIERDRGITVFADQARINYNNSTYYVIDTPGHVDFSLEMERAIQVMDYCVVIVSAVEGIEGHTETVWRLLQKHGVPTFFFINKMDRIGASSDRVIKELNENLTEDVCDFTATFKQREMNENLVEFIAERNETLLEHYMEAGFDKKLWLDTLKTMIKDNKIFPCYSGSALKDEGIIEFFEAFDLLTETTYKVEEDFAGRVYKIRYDENGNRITFIKALQGTIKVRDQISYGEKDNKVSEKVTQLRVYNGQKFETVDQVEAGELFAVSGLSKAATGDGVGSLDEKAAFDMVPTLKSKVIYNTASVRIKDILKSFQVLDQEDPSLQIKWDEQLQEIHIHVMGLIQLEVLEKIVKERFGFDVSFGDPKIIYKETIETKIVGYGHFEPLKHYAEVHLKLEPAEKNSGITFLNECHANDLTIGNQNLIHHHLFERSHHGLLTGSAVTDIKVTLLTGKAHNEHTSGGDFREATFRALRQGLEKAKNVLLEPYYHFKIKVEIDYMGRVLSDIQQASGTFTPPEMMEDKTIITGKVPVATFMNYSTEFASITQGKGTLNLKFAGYDRCHNPDEVMERIAYNKDADPKYTSTSIFCAKGQGYKVPWDQAEKEMHRL